MNKLSLVLMNDNIFNEYPILTNCDIHTDYFIDKNLKVEHYYKNEIIIEKPVHIGVDIITSPNRDLRTPIIMPENEKKFHCVMCNFVCSNKYTYMQHIIYKRHNTPLKPLQK